MDMLSGEARRRLEREDLLEEAVRAGAGPADQWDRIDMYANCQPDKQVYEFENLEELRCFDARYQNHSDNEAMELVSRVFGVPESEIRDLRCLKAGMTNSPSLSDRGQTVYLPGSRPRNRAAHQPIPGEGGLMRRFSP